MSADNFLLHTIVLYSSQIGQKLFIIHRLNYSEKLIEYEIFLQKKKSHEFLINFHQFSFFFNCHWSGFGFYKSEVTTTANVNSKRNRNAKKKKNKKNDKSKI